MENTLENKAKFFAQYWGQEVLIANPDNNQTIPFNNINPWIYHNTDIAWLELKPLSSITDDELGTIARFYNRTATNVYIDQDQLTFDYYHGDETHSAAVELNSGYCLDFLRSNGFAMEWMGLTVGQLQEYGWIKLKSE